MTLNEIDLAVQKGAGVPLRDWTLDQLHEAESVCYAQILGGNAFTGNQCMNAVRAAIEAKQAALRHDAQDAKLKGIESDVAKIGKIAMQPEWKSLAVRISAISAVIALIALWFSWRADRKSIAQPAPAVSNSSPMTPAPDLTSLSVTQAVLPQLPKSPLTNLEMQLPPNNRVLLR